jgi:hydroxyacyl-ACP dehydratase HTD2-like protein with hotdog domain
MFAGARMRFLKPLIIGKPARRQSLIRDVSEKGFCAKVGENALILYLAIRKFSG